MSREIKFRGKLGDEWIYGGLVHDGEGYCIAVNIGTDIPDAMQVTMFKVPIATVGQYTGLKDKDGTEIYEGSLLGYKEYTVPDHTGLWKVAWNGYMWDIITEFEPRFKGDKEKGSYEGGVFFWNCHSSMEVIVKTAE